MFFDIRSTFVVLVEYLFDQLSGYADVQDMQMTDVSLGSTGQQSWFGGHQRAGVICPEGVRADISRVTVQAAGNIDGHFLGQAFVEL